MIQGNNYVNDIRLGVFEKLGLQRLGKSDEINFFNYF